MAFDGGGDDRAISQINVTPLVDVMLVLLVIFMVTAPILQQGVEVNLPRAGAAPLPGDDQQLVVSIAADGGVFLNDESMVLDKLGNTLAAIAAQAPERQVYLRADESVPYGDVMQVIAALKDAGVVRLGMVTDPE